MLNSSSLDEQSLTPSHLPQQPYRDAGYSRADYHLHPQSLFYGLHRATSLCSPPLLDLSTFDLAAYELAEKVETGDWNWITPGFCAFASPVEGAGWREGMEAQRKIGRAFRNVVEEFVGKGVRVVVRCVDGFLLSFAGEGDEEACSASSDGSKVLRIRASLCLHASDHDQAQLTHPFPSQLPSLFLLSLPLNASLMWNSLAKTGSTKNSTTPRTLPTAGSSTSRCTLTTERTRRWKS